MVVRRVVEEIKIIRLLILRGNAKDYNLTFTDYKGEESGQNEMKYLGVLLGKKVTFRRPIEYAKERTQISSQAFSICLQIFAPN